MYMDTRHYYVYKTQGKSMRSQQIAATQMSACDNAYTQG